MEPAQNTAGGQSLINFPGIFKGLGVQADDAVEPQGFVVGLNAVYVHLHQLFGGQSATQYGIGQLRNGGIHQVLCGKQGIQFRSGGEGISVSRKTEQEGENQEKTELAHGHCSFLWNLTQLYTIDPWQIPAKMGGKETNNQNNCHTQ